MEEEQFEGEGESVEQLGWLSGYLDHYLAAIRKLLVIQQQKVSVDADIVVSALQPVDDMVSNIISTLSLQV